MLIIKMNGGLGNQLQQYALYEKMKSMGKDVKLDISWFGKDYGKALKRDLELDYFPNVSYEACSSEELKQVGERSLFRKVFLGFFLVSSNIAKANNMSLHLFYQHDMFPLNDYH